MFIVDCLKYFNLVFLFYFVEERIFVIYLSIVGVVKIIKLWCEDKLIVCGCNCYENFIKYLRKKF